MKMAHLRHSYIEFTCLTVVIQVVEIVSSNYCDKPPEHWQPYHDSEDQCPQFDDRFLTQTQVPWGIEGRAWYTLPPELEIKTSNIPDSGYGVFSKTFIPINTWLGEYEGEVVISKDMITDYAFRIFHNGIITHYIDGGDLRTSGWTRWINCPRNFKEVSVIYSYCRGKVFIISLRNIYPGQELMLYYGDDYARDLGLDPKSFK